MVLSVVALVRRRAMPLSINAAFKARVYDNNGLVTAPPWWGPDDSCPICAIGVLFTRRLNIGVSTFLLTSNGDTTAPRRLGVV